LLVLVAAAACQCPLHSLNQIFNPDYNDAPFSIYNNPAFTGPSTCSNAQYTQLAADIQSLVANGTLSPPTLFRLGFHNCNIGNFFARGYGCNGGWLQYPADADAAQNAGLSDVLDPLAVLRNGYYPCITFADLYTYSGVLGLELSGGPPVAWYPGRADPVSSGPTHPPLSVLLPDGMANAAATQGWGGVLGLTLRETVILLGGGHNIGAASASGWNGSFTAYGDNWPKPNNLYFVDLLNEKWTPFVVQSTGKTQFVCIACGLDPDGNQIIRFPSDMSLRDSVTFSYYSRTYSQDENQFVSDLQYAYQRLLQLGAGTTYTLNNTYQWMGYSGKWNGYGTQITPLSDDFS